MSGDFLVDIVSILVSTRYSTGNGSQTWTRWSVSCMHFLAGGVISVMARMVGTCPGIGRKSSLESFWKCWHPVLKQETASGLSQDIIVKVQDVSI